MGLISGLRAAFHKIVPTRNEKIIREILPLVEKINALEPEFEILDDAQLRGKTVEFRKRLEDGASTLRSPA